jgi:hypothetical protein
VTREVTAMNYDSMKSLLDARPFVPFDLVTSAGQVHRVKHPQFAVLTKTRIVVVDPDADRMAVIPLLHVSEARFVAAA